MVVGSGAAGLLSVTRLSDLGLTVIVIEKAHSMGERRQRRRRRMWIPDHGLYGHVDPR